MIKIIKNLSLILLTSCSLILPSGCGESKTYNYDDYIIKLNVSKNEPFKIMQLSDLHLGINGDIQKQYQFLRKNIFESKPNLIVLTGDSFIYATRELVYDFIDFLNETIDDLEKELNRRVYYTYTYGNHDLQGNYDYYFINNVLLEDSKKTSSSCLFIDYRDINNFFCIEILFFKIIFQIIDNRYFSKGCNFALEISAFQTDKAVRHCILLFFLNVFTD